MLQAQYVDDDPLWKGGRACAFSRRGFAVERCAPVVQPSDVAEQHGECGRGGDHEVGDRLRAPAGFDVAFAQMHEVTLDLRFAGAAQIVA